MEQTTSANKVAKEIEDNINTEKMLKQKQFEEDVAEAQKTLGPYENITTDNYWLKKTKLYVIINSDPSSALTKYRLMKGNKQVGRLSRMKSNTSGGAIDSMVLAYASEYDDDLLKEI